MFAVIYNSGSDADESGARRVVTDAADALKQHLRLLFAKVDIAGLDGQRLHQQYVGGGAMPAYVLLNGPYEHTAYRMGDTSSASAAEELVSWLLEQVRHAWQHRRKIRTGAWWHPCAAVAGPMP